MAEDQPEQQEETMGQQRRSPSAPSGGAVYGLGFIGAVVWFWKQADGAPDRLLGVLKAMVWPAFLVYEAFAALQRSGSD